MNQNRGRYRNDDYRGREPRERDPRDRQGEYRDQRTAGNDNYYSSQQEFERINGTPEQRRRWEQAGRKIEEGYHPELDPRDRYRDDNRSHYPSSQESQSYRSNDRDPRAQEYREPYRRGFSNERPDERWMGDASDFRQDQGQYRPHRDAPRSQWEDEGSSYGTSSREYIRQGDESRANQAGWQEHLPLHRPTGDQRQRGDGYYNDSSRSPYGNDERRIRPYRQSENQPETYENAPRYYHTHESGQDRDFYSMQDQGSRGERRPSIRNQAQRKIDSMNREEVTDREANRRAQLQPQGTQGRVARRPRSNPPSSRGTLVDPDSGSQDFKQGR